MAFAKLDRSLLDSSLWRDKPGTHLFLTALLMAEPREFPDPVPEIATSTLEFTGWIVPAGWYGFVPASGPGLIRRAAMELEEGRVVLARLASPDSESRSNAFAGRRLVRVDGGFLVLNFMKYRERDLTGAERARRYREATRKKKAVKPEQNRPSRRDAVTSRVTSRDVTLQMQMQKQSTEAEDLAKNEHPAKEISVPHARSSSARARDEIPESLWQPPTPNPHGSPVRLINGHAQRQHGQHVWCSLPREGLCVCQTLHREFQGKSLKSDADLKAWYATTLAKFDGHPIGDDRFAFWRNEFAGWIGTVTVAASHWKTKGNASVVAYHRFAEGLKSGRFQ